MAETAEPRRTASQIPYYSGAFVLGLALFGLGLLVDSVGEPGAAFPGYAPSYLIPAEAVLGIVLTVLLGFIAGRPGGLAIWHACLWMGAGLVVGWLGLIAYGLGGAA